MMEGSLPAAQRFMRQAGMTAPAVVGTMELAAAYRMQVYPWTVIIDREGKPREALRGGHSVEQFRKAFAKYL
jgi:hypothetical protein